MINKILVYPRRVIEKLLDGKIYRDLPIDKSWALISIFGTCGDDILIQDKHHDILKKFNCKDWMSVCFDDITDKTLEGIEEDNAYYKDLVLIDTVQAKLIVEFLDRVKENCEVLVVHCAAGISRSGAVGLFACRYFGLDENDYRGSHPFIHPNFYVVSVLNDYIKKYPK